MKARLILVAAVMLAVFGARYAIAQTKRALPALGSSQELVAADLIATCSVEAASALPVLSSGIPANLTPTQRTQWAKSQIAGIAMILADPEYDRDGIKKQNASDTLKLSSPDEEVQKTASYGVCATKRRLEYIAAQCAAQSPSAAYERSKRLLDAIMYFPMLEAVELGLEKEQAAALRDPRRLLWTYRVLILDVDAGMAAERNCSSVRQDPTEIEMRDKALRECPQRFSRQECTRPLGADELKGPPPPP